MGRVLVGTSGYSYRDWVGPFYPAGLPAQEYLSFYTSQFPVVELNFSYYHQPEPAMLRRMAESTPPGFQFALKAHRSMTHEIGESWERDIDTFKAGVRPLADAGKLAAVLLQFPYSFAYTVESRTRLAALCAGLSGLPLAVEFRKSEWLSEPVLEGLRSRGVALVSVDEPALPKLLPPTAEVTADLSYVRFHGRNKEAWWTGTNVTRYDYRYQKEELVGWVDRIKAMLERARTIVLFFNNHAGGNAAQNAREMRTILDGEGIE